MKNEITNINELLKNKIVIPIKEKLSELSIKIENNISSIKSLKILCIVLSVITIIDTLAIAFILFSFFSSAQ